MINGIPESRMEYLKSHVPDEYDRIQKLFNQSIENAKKNSLKKKRMIERLAVKRKRFELADRYGV